MVEISSCFLLLEEEEKVIVFGPSFGSFVGNLQRTGGFEEFILHHIWCVVCFGFNEVKRNWDPGHGVLVIRNSIWNNQKHKSMLLVKLRMYQNMELNVYIFCTLFCLSFLFSYIQNFHYDFHQYPR